MSSTEFENENKQLSFLDLTTANTGNNSCDFKIYRTTSITIVQTKRKTKYSTTYHSGST